MKKLLLFLPLILAGCNNLTPQQVQIIAATTAATVAVAGNTAAAFPNKNLSPAQIQALTNAAGQTAILVGQAAGQWKASPTPAPTP